jgi:hypothetical protein
VLAVERHGEHVLLDVSLPPDVAEVTVLHGSITIDGVSLTVNALPAPDSAQVALIPYTWDHTNLSRLEPGSTVNLEGDMLGRFVVHYLKLRQGGALPGGRAREPAMPFDRVEDAIQDIRDGKLVIVADDEDRENEGDLVCAASCITPELVNFMATHGRGLICVALTEERAEALDLTPMTKRNRTSWARRSRCPWTRTRASA